MVTLYSGDKETMMTLFEILLSAFAVCFSGGAIAYTFHVVRKTAAFERPGDAQVRQMIDTAPRGKFDNALAR
jgi:hypothetical protein